MCQCDTSGGGLVRAKVLVCALLAAFLAPAQSASGIHPDWRHIGNAAVDLALASPASGPVDRVWFSADGSRLFARTYSGRVFQTTDFEKWQPSDATPPTVEGAAAAVLPDGGRQVRWDPANRSRLYAFGRDVFRSDDGGQSWTNLTAFQRQSIIGGGMHDAAVSPVDGDQIIVANDAGVWRSLDGGVSWVGLNDSIPNLPVERLVGLPRGSSGVRVLTSGFGEVEWAPGEKQAWRPAPDPARQQQAAERWTLSIRLGASVTAFAPAGDIQYAGSADGRIWVSFDKGRNWNASSGSADRGPVAAIFVDPKDAHMALAALAGTKGPRVLRTINGGEFWDDLSSDLPEGAAHGIAADRAGGSVYVATDRGVFLSRVDLNAAGPASTWTPLSGLPAARAEDVKLDSDGNQLFVALEGYGVYAAMAPHRLDQPRLVNAADFSSRAAAPGSLLSVLGRQVRAARAGDLNAPVLAASGTESQIQVPFGVSGPSVSLALDTAQGSYRVALPIENVSPAIFVDRDGTPLVMNADSGVLLDVMNPARSNSRLQILATGLGQVRPGWPAGMAAPVDNPPQVIAPVRAYLDGAPLEVTRAILAPGYVGLYLIEVQLPPLVNAGTADLHLEAESQPSNHVRIWLEP